MRLFRHYQGLPADMRGSAVAVGNFDGIHLGHRQVIREAGQLAHAEGVPWAVLTFEPHPRQLFHPDAEPFRLTPLPVKARLVEETGADLLVVVPFDADFARLSAREFVEAVLVEGLGARHVVCGHDFAFGHGRKGTPELLLWLGDEFGFAFTCVTEVKGEDGEPYASTRIREFLRCGQPEDAARMLGRPFQIEGEVGRGDERGRLLGFPTANLALNDFIRPARGVYAVRVGVAAEDGWRWYDGVANIGRRPTFGGETDLLEAHLFDFADDLYGQDLRVQLLAFLRPEKRFDGLPALQAQIAADCEEARRRLSRPGEAVPMLRAGQG
jgi:riboflavin kinase/FMN adenylyltransferase